jgi:hypothetical protein
MAAHRKFVPLRQIDEDFRVGDGTMCRMLSPRPGPLRCEIQREELVEFVSKEKKAFPGESSSLTQASRFGATGISGLDLDRNRP